MPKIGKVKLPDLSVAGFEGWMVYYALFFVLVAAAVWAWQHFHKTG
jgi:hypothetical protein